MITWYHLQILMINYFHSLFTGNLCHGYCDPQICYGFDNWWFSWNNTYLKGFKFMLKSSFKIRMCTFLMKFKWQMANRKGHENLISFLFLGIYDVFTFFSLLLLRLFTWRLHSHLLLRDSLQKSANFSV